MVKEEDVFQFESNSVVYHLVVGMLWTTVGEGKQLSILVVWCCCHRESNTTSHFFVKKKCIYP
jgi:hypothetical protein